MLIRLLLLSLLHSELNSCIRGANILAIDVLLSPSHHIFHDVYLLELAKRGHNVTLLGHYEDKHGHPNYTHIVLEGVYDKMKENFNVMEIIDLSIWETLNALWSVNELTCILDQQTKGLKKIIQYPDDFKFDLIIWDLNAGYCLYPLVEKFGRPPIISVNPFFNQPNIFRNIWQSYIPFVMCPYRDHMSFLQRVTSNFYSLLMEVTKIFQYLPRQKELAEIYFGKVNLTIEEVERNISLQLINHNPVFNYAEAFPPNIIPIGGLHIQPKPLPDDLKYILDNSEFGVILFSLGSNVRSKELGENKIKAITKCFGRLKQTVIWKFENDKFQNLPKNVYVRRWVPQNDILGHPKTILFITHGGLLSSHETVFNGVPVIGIPFFLDQIPNVENFVSKGMGEKIEFQEITDEKLCYTIQKVLNEKSYRNTAKKLSAFYKDRQNEPLDTAIYWIEYILKHKTATHMNLATRDMSLVEFFNLDIILFYLLLISIFFVVSVNVIVFLFKHIYNNCRTKTKTKTY